MEMQVRCCFSSVPKARSGVCDGRDESSVGEVLMLPVGLISMLMVVANMQ